MKILLRITNFLFSMTLMFNTFNTVKGIFSFEKGIFINTLIIAFIVLINYSKEIE